MTDQPFEPSRRQLLGAVSAVGALSVTAGVTAARLADHEGAGVTIQTGEVSISVDCSSCVEDDGSIGFGFDGLEPGTTGTETLTITVEDNPARLWVRTECPPAVDPLGKTLQVTLSLERQAADDSDTTTETLFQTDSLQKLRRELRDGIRLDDRIDGPCVSGTEELSLVLEYELPTEATWTADSHTELQLTLFAEQCRHISEDDVEDPFGDANDCPTLECPDCKRLGKHGVTGSTLEPGTYPFDELYNEFDDHEDEYELEVLTATNKDDGETVCASIRLLKNGEESEAPPICTVEVGGGRPANPPGPAIREYEVDPPLTRTRKEVCTKLMANGNKPAISNITVYVCPEGEEA